MYIAKGAFSTPGSICFKTGFAGFTLEICILEERWAVLARQPAFVSSGMKRSQAASNVIVLFCGQGIELGSSLDASCVHPSLGGF